MPKFKGSRTTIHYLDDSATPNEYKPWDGKVKNTLSDPVVVSSHPSGYIFRKDDTGAGIVYYGFAAPGSAESSLVWILLRVVKTSGLSTSSGFADGNTNADNSWTNRASYSYS